MAVYKGKGMVKGRGEGPALVTTKPLNLAASFTKIANLFRRGEVRDRHHELFGKNVTGTVLVFPTCIGSTLTGLVVLELAHRHAAPAAMIVRTADPLLVSGASGADVWYGCGVPIIEYKGDDFYAAVSNGSIVIADANTGEITLKDSSE